MATEGDWNDVVLALRRAPGGDPWKGGRDVKRLFDIAEEDGLRAIRSFVHDFGEATIRDLIRDFLTLKLREIVSAQGPRAYFWRALQNRARSHWRKQSSEVVEAPSADTGTEHDRDPSSDRAFVHDARAALSMLSPRHRGIVIAVGTGDDREEVARAFKTSRANVDQIVSRARKMMRPSQP